MPEVCVVGGGPAGATVASRLAQLGHEVVVFERERFPRPHVGESLSPGAWPLLELLGLREATEAAGFRRARVACVAWGGPERSRESDALTVDRATFDALLLRHAVHAGATIVHGHDARPACALADAPPFLVDASGRRRALGGARRRTSPRTLALHAVWHGARDGGADTFVEARADHWLWGGHLPGGGFRAMLFLEPARVRRAGLGALYRELVLGAPLFAAVLAHASAGAVQACDASCYSALDPVSDAIVKVGEAAFAIDPLSSSGVQSAIQSGLAAAVAIHTILEGERDAAIAYLRDHQRHAVEHHAALAARAYADCHAYAGEPFWTRRAASAQAPPARDPVSLEALLPRPVRLAPGAALAPVPCVVGDRVAMRRALTDASLARPVAFLGGVELAPLLDRLDGGRPLSELPRPVASWLAARGLLEPV